MTITIKKNVDVQGTLEAKQLKYQVKRDLSGDVQFENAPSLAGTAGIFKQSTGSTSSVVTATTNTGLNFLKVPGIKSDGRATVIATGGFPISIAMSLPVAVTRNSSPIAVLNGSRTVVTTLTAGNPSFSTQWNATIAPSTTKITTVIASPATIKFRVSANVAAVGTPTLISASQNVYATGYFQKNQKVTVMK